MPFHEKYKEIDKEKGMHPKPNSPLLSPTYYSDDRHRISVIGVAVQQAIRIIL